MQRSLPAETNDVKHVRGIVRWTRGDEPIAQRRLLYFVGDGPHLDGKFAAFGRVLRGIEVAARSNRRRRRRRENRFSV